MHETGIALEVLRVAAETARGEGARRVTRIWLRVGRWSGVEAETLRFALEALAEGPMLEGCAVEIEAVEPAFECGGCGEAFTGESHLTPCPRCGGREGRLVAGDELTLARLEVDDG